MNFLIKNNKIFIAGSNGMVGSSISRLLNKKGFSSLKNNLLEPKRDELDLTDINKVRKWFSENKPDIVINAAGKVGGILANSINPVQFLLDNMKIQNNLIEASWEFGTKRFLFLGSSCIYPKFSEQPIKEEFLLTSKLEETNQWYAIAKISGLKLCEAYRNQYNFDTISLMPTNLYGPRDSYDLKNCHVMAALIRKFYEAKKNNYDEVICWGTGKPLREFLYVEDFAEACIYLLENWFPNKNLSISNKNNQPINWLNVGSDFEISIKDLALLIAKIVGYKGKIVWDKNKPDGTPRKKLDTTLISNIGWNPKTNLETGIKKTLDSFSKEFEELS